MPTFAELVQKHQGLVLRTLARLLGDADEVEDLAQEVFLRLFRSLPHFRGEAKLSTFLYRIIANVAKDELRRRKHARWTVSIDDEEAGWEDSLPHPAPGPGEVLEGGRFFASLHNALGQLSLRDRTILTLYFQEECSYQEIGEILDLPMGTVKTHLHRARQKLKAAMREQISACKTKF